MTSHEPRISDGTAKGKIVGKGEKPTKVAKVGEEATSEGVRNEAVAVTCSFARWT